MKAIRSWTIIITLVATLATAGISWLPDAGYAATGPATAPAAQDASSVRQAAPASAQALDSVALGPETIVNGVSITIDSHESESVQVYPKGSSVHVDFTCQDNSASGNYIGYIGLYDTVAGVWLDLYETDPILGYEAYHVDLDTTAMLLNTVAVADRYVVDAFVVDNTTDIVVAEDYFYLQLKSFGAPTNVVVKETGPHSVQVSWTTEVQALTDQVYMATAAAGPYTYLGTVSDSNIFNKSGLTTGKTYYFKIRTYSTGISTKTYSGYSVPGSGVPKPLAPKAAVTSKAYDTLTVSWGSVSGANGYVVYRLDAGTGTYVQLGTTTATSATYTGLTTGKTYTYKVKAWHTESNGTKYYSNLSSAASGTPIPAPVACTATLATYNSAIITWSTVAGADGYAVYRKQSDWINGPVPDGECIALLGSGARSWTDVCPVPGTYYYEVLAYRIVNSVYYYALPGGYALGAHTGVAYLGQMPISFSYNGARYVTVEGIYMPQGTAYEIWRASSDNPGQGFVSISPSLMYTSEGIHFTEYDLIPGVSYTYKIRPYLMVNGRKVTGPVSFNTIDIVLPTPQMNSFVNQDKTIWIYGYSVQGATGYEVQRSLDGETFEQVYLGANTGFTEASLTPGTTYYYRARALYAPSGYSTPWSETMTVTAPSR